MNEVERCQVCRRSFWHDTPKGKPVPEICGQLACRARHEWTAGDWEGAARMAAARQQAGLPLNGIDEEALTRRGAR